MSSLHGGRKGSQTPRLSSVPPFSTTAGPDAVEYAASVGLHLDPWQALVLEGALGEIGPAWAAFEVGVVVGRQNGKGAILEARELAGVMLFGEKLVLHTAHELKTSEEARLRMEQIIESSPELDRACKRIVRSNGKEAIEFRNGARIKYVARSKGSGRGFTGDLIVMDEAMYLDAEPMAALLPTLSARPNPQLWYTGSAGFPTSTQLNSVRERARAGGDPGLAYFEWSATEGADLDDRDEWSRANPALGIRISEAFIERERRSLMAMETEFARERLGLWADETSEQVIDPVLWARLTDRDSTVPGRVAFAVDVTPDRRSASIAVAGRREDGLLHVGVVANRPGTGWLVDEVAELMEHRPLAVALDPGGPAGSLLPDFREAGVEIREISTRELGQACGGFYDETTQEQVRHLGQPELDQALAVARKKPLGDAWRWSRKDGADISPLYAVTVARFAFLDVEPESSSAYEDRGMVTL